MDRPQQTAAKVAYVMTHYPRVALAFISNEIDTLERLGMQIQPFAMNNPESADLLSEDARSRRDRTIFLKQSWLRLFGQYLRLLFSHPFNTIRLTALTVGSARTDLSLIARRLSHLLQASLTAKYCDRHRIRHLHAHFGQAPATIAWLATEILNFRPSSHRASWSFTIHGFQDFVDEAVARLDIKAASAGFIACISDFTRSQLYRVSAPEHWPKAHVIRCGIDLNAFKLRHPSNSAMPSRIVSVGRLSPEKGQLVLLQACHILLERGQQFDLALIGSGPFEDRLRLEIERLELTDRVELLGELPPERVLQELEQSSVFCLASFSEGLPVSIMEAMAVGLPVVTTTIAGIPELAVNDQTALTAPPGNAEALANALARILQDQALEGRLTEAARVRVESMHDLEVNMRAKFELFQPYLTARPGIVEKGI